MIQYTINFIIKKKIQRIDKIRNLYIIQHNTTAESYELHHSWELWIIWIWWWILQWSMATIDVIMEVLKDLDLLYCWGWKWGVLFTGSNSSPDVLILYTEDTCHYFEHVDDSQYFYSIKTQMWINTKLSCLCYNFEIIKIRYIHTAWFLAL